MSEWSFNKSSRFNFPLFRNLGLTERISQTPLGMLNPFHRLPEGRALLSCDPQTTELGETGSEAAVFYASCFSMW